MCLGVPAQVVDIHDTARATVGFALGKIDEAEATETLKQIKQLGGGTFEDELESFTSSQIE